MGYRLQMAELRKQLRPRDLDMMTDEELLALRFCDLPIRLQGTETRERVLRLYEELENRGITFRPPVWLSNEWFSPDGIPGIAIPFYLAHPRLAKLEQKQMLEVEGAGERECMKILRHEAGHAVDTAFRLHYRREWQRLFGYYTQSYPDFYRPKPTSRDFVLHLNNWYAQAHPAEDFAETFAVWLTPNLRWRQYYADWPAIHKLEYVDSLMNSLAGASPAVLKQKELDAVPCLQKTLARHYRERKAHYGIVTVDYYTRDLVRLFSDHPRFVRRRSAASFIRSFRTELRGTVAYWTGTYQYTVDQVLEGMIERSKQLKLRLTQSEGKTRRDLTTLVTAITMNMIHSGRNRVAL